MILIGHVIFYTYITDINMTYVNQTSIERENMTVLYARTSETWEYVVVCKIVKIRVAETVKYLSN